MFFRLRNIDINIKMYLNSPSFICKFQDLLLMQIDLGSYFYGFVSAPPFYVR